MKKITAFSTAFLVAISICLPAQAGWTVYNLDDGFLVSDNITALHTDDYGDIWIGDASQGVIQFDGISHGTLYNTNISDLISDLITDITDDGVGNIWIATFFGISRFDRIDNWHSYNSDSGMPHVDVQDIAIGSDAMIWLGIPFAGLTKFDGDSTYIHYITDSGLVDNRVRDLLPDDSGRIWIATLNGVSRFDGDKNWQNYTIANSGLLDSTVYSLRRDTQGNLWFGSATGVSRLSPDSVWTTFTTLNGLAPGAVTAIDIDSAGNIWFGHDNTDRDAVYVTEFDGVSEWTIHNIGNSALVDFIGVTDIAVDTAGNVWVATDGEGISKYDGVPNAVGDDIDATLPKSFILKQNYPNPFNASTAIEFDLMRHAHVKLTIITALGQKVTTLLNQDMRAGTHRVFWNGTDDYGTTVASGVYFYKLETDAQTASRMMILMK